MRVLDTDASLLDAQDAVGDVAELEHIPLQALDREVLVHRADELRLRLEDHLIVGAVGNGAAGGDGGEARVAPSLHELVHRVVVDERAVAPAARAVAFGEHAQHLIELCPLKLAIPVRPAHQGEQLLLRPLACSDLCHDLLCEHVEGLARHHEPVELAAAHRGDERGAFDEVIAREREQPSLGRAAHRVAGAADALQEGGDRARRGELTHEVHLADVDAELE